MRPVPRPGYLAAPYLLTTRNMAIPIQSAVAKLMAAYPPRSQEETADPVVAARLFDAFGSATWWLTEYDPEDRCAFGFVT